MFVSKPLPTTQKMRGKATRFRILVVGRANSGKTTILRRLCNTTGEPMIFSPNGEKIESSAIAPCSRRGEHDIENQMIFEGYPDFIFHDSCGFETSSTQELNLVQEFMERRSKAQSVNEQLHAIWYCIPTSDDRPISAVEKKFFNEAGTGLVPVIVLWTKTEFLDVVVVKQLMKEGKTVSEAKQQAPQKAWAEYERNVHQRFEEFEYPPKAYVVFRKMHEPGADCKDLIEITRAVLFGEDLQGLSGVRRTVNSTESAQLENYKGGQALVSARNVLITSSNLVTVRNGGFHNHNHVHVAYDNRNDIWDKLRTMVAFGALHDSAARHNPPKCHPNTRRAVLKQIMEWVNNLEKIIWLYGSAGTGKTTLAQSITELCHEMNILAASFSFSTTVEGCSDSTRLIVTIAYQLCLSIPEVRCYIEAVVERDPNILQWSLDAQIQKFIIWPLSQIKSQLTSPQAVNSRPNLIVIDGLDECGNEDMQCCVLRALSAVFKSHEFPICFLITSRPEQHIREFFQAGPLRSMTKFLPLDNTYSDDDIQAFLRSNFDDIKREHPLKSHIPVSWPPETVIKRLVQQSSGQFIYASAVTKYMKSPQHQPTERLNHIFGITDGGSDNPFAELDVLYNRIFSLVDDIHTVLDVLSILLHLKHYWFPRTVNLKLMEGLLDLERGTLHHKLVHLHSILDIPAPDDDKTEIRILHASLNDFLRDETRSRQYHIDASRAHAKLTQRFMTFIPIAHKKNYNMDDLARLSCQFFMVHCVLSYPTPELLEDLRNFDISGFLNLLSSLGLSPVTINRQISDLFAWLNQSCMPLGKDLQTYYLRAWDKHILASLVRDTFRVRLTSLFVVSALHPQFWKHCTVVREIVNWKEPPYEALRLPNTRFQFLCAGEPDEEEPDGTGYHKMLSQFLNDSSRSGPFYADEAKFTYLSTKTVQFITDSEVETSQFTFTDNVLPYDDLRIWASQCLPFFLSKASRTDSLATRLETDLLPLVNRFKYHSQKKKFEVIHAINSYIYGVSEPMAEAPQREDSAVIESTL